MIHVCLKYQTSQFVILTHQYGSCLLGNRGATELISASSLSKAYSGGGFDDATKQTPQHHGQKSSKRWWALWFVISNSEVDSKIRCSAAVCLLASYLKGEVDSCGKGCGEVCLSFMINVRKVSKPSVNISEHTASLNISHRLLKQTYYCSIYIQTQPLFTAVVSHYRADPLYSPQGYLA